MSLQKVVRQAAFDKGITGVLAMSEHCGAAIPSMSPRMEWRHSRQDGGF